MKTPTSKSITFACLITSVIALSACGTETHRSVDPIEVNVSSNYKGDKSSLAIGNFSNKSPYLKGVFSDESDKLGNQAKEILKSQLIKTNRFDLMERDNFKPMEREAKYLGTKQKIAGARYIVTGSVTDFGRKVTGSNTFFGLFGSSKQQVAYSRITLNVVDITTSRSVYSVDGAGEFELSTAQVLGTGSKAGYDSTLNSKVLNLAIVNAVNDLVVAIENGTCELGS